MMKMSNRKLVIRAALAMVAGLGIASSSWAATTSTVTVTTHVIDSCTITTSSNLAFAAYDPLSVSPLTGNGAVSVTCTKGANGVTLGVDNGANYSSAAAYLTKRSMAGAVGGDFLAYDLFQPDVAGNSGVTTGTAFGTSGPGLFAIPSTSFTSGLSGVTVKIFGSIPASQDVTGQSGTGNVYTDTVTATVSF
jgi:spore coat protein U-like protein